MTENLNKQPVPDRAEHNAFFPSEYSLSLYTSKKSDFSGYETEPLPAAAGRKILMIASDERYVRMKNGRFFSTGNHPVETLLPMMHLAHAGFDIEPATLSGNMVKLEMWAMPTEDKAVTDFYESCLPKLEAPKRLSDIVGSVTAPDSPYAGVFIPGGHAALLGLPFDLSVKKVLFWAMREKKAVISLCHGPAGFLAASVGEKDEDFLFRGYDMMVFPDALDEGANQDIGYMPGRLPWLLAARLEKLGVRVLNTDITGAVHRDRNVLTGDSPLAANRLGIEGAKILSEMLRQ
ncbi:MAG: Protein deglycase HchA [Burkholderia sp.]|jgi:D-lactate dehydratase / protein deglycase